MNDVFYFSPADISIEDIAKYAHVAGMQEIVVDLAGEAISARTESGNLIGVYKVQIDKYFDEAEDLPWLRETHIVSGFIFAHRRISLPPVLDLLRKLLAAYGGWVGNDSDAFEPRFNLQNIDTFNYGPDVFGG